MNAPIRTNKNCYSITQPESDYSYVFLFKNAARNGNYYYHIEPLLLEMDIKRFWGVKMSYPTYGDAVVYFFDEADAVEFKMKVKIPCERLLKPSPTL